MADPVTGSEHSLNQRPVIRIFHNMARSGGTMVCKCIGAMEPVRLFSEIHPAANQVEYLNLTDQAHRWYGLATTEDVDAVYPFVEGLRRVHQRCIDEGYQMVLRDWAVIDFLGRILVEQPVYRHSLNHVLKDHFDIVEVSLVRHPLDQWLSTCRLNIYRDKIDSADFFLGYLKYVEAAAGHFIRYEDFTAAPGVVMQDICHQLALEYDPGFIDRWHHNRYITGDNKNSSRGSKGDSASVIRPLPRREVEPAFKAQIEQDENYQRVISLLGYQDAGYSS